MFQWPKIPEILMSIRDYKAIGDFFTKPPVVRCIRTSLCLMCMYVCVSVGFIKGIIIESISPWLHVVCMHNIIDLYLNDFV